MIKSPKYAVFFITKAKEPFKIKISNGHQCCRWFSKNDLNTIDYKQPFYKNLLKDILQPLL